MPNKSTIMPTGLLVLALLVCSWSGPSQARSTGFGSPYQESTTPTTTTTEVPYLDNPTNSAATTSETETEAESPEDICFRCFDKIKTAEDLIDTQTRLVEKQKKLIQRKSKAALAARSADSQTSSSSSSSSANQQRTTRKPASIRNRTLVYQEDEPIVVSTLRVARSTSIVDQGLYGGQSNNNNNNKKFGRNKKDPDLKQLKLEQEQQLNITCKSLVAVQECLADLSRTCIGDLQFHSQEVWANQWHSKLVCPYRNNPGIRVWSGLTPKIWIDNESEKSRVPIARPISSPDEVRERLNKMFPQGGFRPPGVILQPTPSSANNQNLKTASQIDQQQQQQPLDKGPHMMRKFIGHQLYQQNSIRQQSEQRVQFADTNDEVNLVNVGKVMLVPCCFVIMVAFALLISLYIRQEPEDVKM